MITTTDIVEKLITRYPLYGEAMAEGIVNYSELARKLKPEVEELRMEPVTDGSVIMALKRHAETLKEKKPNVEFVHRVRNIMVRSDLAEMAFKKSPKLHKVHQEILKIAEDYDEAFTDYSEGHSETSFVVSEVLLPHLKRLTKGEECIAEYNNLSSISIHLPDDTVNIPGVYYPFIKAFAWERINFVEILSHFTELNFIIADKDVERAFSVIKALAKRGENRVDSVHAK